ncbi:MAG: caspase family protein, partial [Rubrivivax sp.]
WLLLADDPRAVTLGGLLADFTVFGLEGGAGVIPATGNVFGFGVPAVTITGSAGDPATASTISILEATRTAVTMPMAFSTPTKSRLFDAAVALDGGEGQPERTLDWASLPRDEAISLLAARGRYKQKVFAKGVYRLQQDPRLADAPACANEAEAQSGKCIVTEALKRQLLAARPSSQALLPSAQALRPGQRRVVRAELPGIERKLALLIGINRYEDRRVPELTGAVPDVQAVRDLLEGRLGYETTVLENASREEIVRAFNRLALQAQANDSVIIYYAGHGVVVPMAGIDTGYWLPTDVDSEFPQTWLANADIARLVAAIGARQLMLVSDSCYSGTLVGKERVQLHSGAPNADEMLRRRAAVSMSSGGDEPVADSGRGGHSIFAWHFMRALEELDHWQVGGNLFERVKAAVVRDFPQTPQYGASRSAGHQGDTDYLFERRALEGSRP